MDDRKRPLAEPSAQDRRGQIASPHRQESAKMNLLKPFCRAAVFIFILSNVVFAAQYSIEGYWEGAIIRDGAVRIIKIDFVKDGSIIRGHIEMPDLMTYGLGPVVVKYEALTVSLRLPAVGQATLTLDPSIGEMTGTVRANGPPITIHLKRTVKPLEMPLKKEEVQFSNGDVSLAGTLILPAAAGPHPAILWVSGRGGTLREESARTRLFARYGIASLIYDKRGSGKSTGSFETATIENLISDALAAVKFLSTRADINAKQIGLHGESAGGWIVPVVATRSKVSIAFIMTSAGPAESLYDQQAHAYRYYLLFSDIEFTDEELRIADAHIQMRLRVAFKNEGREEFQASAAKLKGTRMERFLLDSEAADASDFDWLRRNDCDPAPHLKKITAPFLAFYGSRDYIVPPQENVKRLESYLTEAGNKDFKIVTIEGGNHDLSFRSGRLAKPDDPADKARWVWARVSPDYVETMLKWLLERVTVAPSR